MKNDLLAILALMIKIRMVEQYIAKRYPEEQMKCPTHLCVGQEAVPAVLGVATRAEDIFMGTYRSHGHYMAKGGDITALFAELLGKPSGCSKGFGGSMHLIDVKRNFMGTSAIVASGIPIAAGAALRLQYQKRGGIVVVFFGDAALEKGEAYETANFAALHKLPLLMICENNELAVTTPLKIRQASLSLYNRFAPLGIHGKLVKKNDVSGLINTVRQEIDSIRKGKGPALIEYHTARYSVHVGHAMQGPVDLWWQSPFSPKANTCPIAFVVRKLLQQKLLTMEKLERLRQQMQKDIEKAYEKALAAPSHKKADINAYVYASGLVSSLPTQRALPSHTLTSEAASKLVNPF